MVQSGKQNADERLTPASDADSRQAALTLMVDGPALQRLMYARSELERAGLRLVAAQVLAMLMLEPGSGVMRISDRLALSKTIISTALRDLRERGLVSRRPDPTDGRRQGHHLTPRGKAQLQPLVGHATAVLVTHPQAPPRER